MAAVRLTRRVSFSSGHRYWLNSMSEAENRSLFGKWASPFNHGHNYVLDVTVEGDVDSSTGMVVNIKTIDDVLQERIVSRFDQKSINDEIPRFQNQSSSLENLLLYISGELSHPRVLPARLVHLKLEETPLLYAELNQEKQSMTLTRVYEFAAAHRLHSDILSSEENLALFGKCNNPAGHGHNYILEVSVEGEPDPKTGMMVSLEDLDSTVNQLVVDRYDHKHLNCDLPEFHGIPPTTENIALQIFETLRERLPARLSRIRLHETARNIFEVSAS